MKKPLAFLGLAVGAVVGLSMMAGLGMYAAYRDNRQKCDAPLAPGATADLSIALPAGVQVCRKLDRSESSDMELLVETPGPLCFASMGQLGCPSMVKSELRFVTAMAGAGWDVGDVRPEEVRFSRGKGESASVRFRRSRYGELAASMTVYFPPTKVGKE